MGDPPQRNSTTVTESVTAEHVGERLRAHLAEYNALRKEIEWLDQGARQYYNLGVLLIGAAAAALPIILDKASQLIIPVLLTISLFFLLLGYLYFLEQVELFRIASYLDKGVGEAIRNLLDDKKLLGWEDFKYRAQQRAPRPEKPHFPFLNPVRVRSVLFPLTSLIALIGVYTYAGQAILPFSQTYNAAADGLLSAWLGLDTLLTLWISIWILTQGNLAKRFLRRRREGADKRGQLASGGA